MGLEVRTNLPKVPYPTALDFFVFSSYLFIFATVIQFAMVHYFTKYGSGEIYFRKEEASDEEEEIEEEDDDKQDNEASRVIFVLHLLFFYSIKEHNSEFYI